MQAFVPHLLISILVLVCSQAALRLAHAHGWHPDRQIAEALLWVKLKARKAIIRVVRSLESPPEFKDAPELHWSRDKGQWRATWIPRVIPPGSDVRAYSMFLGKKSEVTEVAEIFIFDCCVALQKDMIEKNSAYRREARTAPTGAVTAT